MSFNASNDNLMFNFHLHTRIIFGRETSKKLLDYIASFDAKKILICTDSNIQEIGITDRIKKPLLLARFEVKVYDKIKPEPKIQIYEAITDVVRTDEFDLVIGVGGGSVLDVAKISAAMATNSGELIDYIPKVFNINLLKKKSLPLILLPTTAGTGSEVSSNVMIMDDNSKIFMSSPHLFANIAIVDPELTLTVPQKITAFTGIDTLTHIIEGLMSKRCNPIIEPIALHAASYVGKYLKNAYENGQDIEGRTGMSLASLLGGIALSAGVVYGHSMAYTIAGRYNLPHGISCAIPIPYVMKFNFSSCKSLFAKLSKSLGAWTKGQNEDESAHHVIIQVKKLIEYLNLPTNLSEVGVKKEMLPILAKECVERYPRKNNPIELTYEDALRLYENAWEGRYEEKKN